MSYKEMTEFSAINFKQIHTFHTIFILLSGSTVFGKADLNPKRCHIL